MRCRSIVSAVVAASAVLAGCDGGDNVDGDGAVDVVVLRQPGPASEGPDPTDPTAEPPTDVDTGDGVDDDSDSVDDGVDGVDDSVDGVDDGAAPEEPPPPPAPEEPAPCPRVRVDVADGATLNVRPSPDTQGAPLLALADGAIVAVVDVAVGADVAGVDVWYGVDVDGVYGFVSGAYAVCTEDEAPVVVDPVVDDGFFLPLSCGSRVRIAQGNFGQFSHSGRSRYAFDFSIPVDTPMVAMERGTIAATFDQTGPGDRCYNGGGEDCFRFANYVALRHPDGSVSIYKHLNRVDVSVGDVVDRGEVIGLSGSTGYSTGPHAHVMRQQDCGGDQLACESLPLVFVDVDGDGVPARDDWVTSGNCGG